MDKKGAEPFTKCPGICLLGESITFLNHVKKTAILAWDGFSNPDVNDDHHQHHHFTLTLYQFFHFDYDNDILSDCVASKSISAHQPDDMR